MDNLHLDSLFEQQMAQIQRKVQDKLLHMEEDQQWKELCQKHGIINSNSDSDACEKHEDYCPKYNKTSVKLDDLPKKPKTSIAKQNFTTSRNVAKPMVNIIPRAQDNITKPIQEMALRIKLLEDRFFKFQGTTNENLRSGLRPRRFSDSSYPSSIENDIHHASNHFRNEALLLRGSLHKVLSKMDFAKPITSEEMISTSSGSWHKGVTFQVPYVLKKQKALKKRMQNFSNTCLSRSPNRVVTKRNPPVAWHLRRNNARCQSNKRNILLSPIKEESMTSDEATEIQIAEKPNIQENINFISNKIMEVEETEKTIWQRWTSKAFSTCSTDALCSKKSSKEESAQAISISGSIYNSDNNYEESESAWPLALDSTDVLSKKLSSLLISHDHLLSVDSLTVQNIVSYKRRFIQFIQRTSHLNANCSIPWKSLNQIADSVLDDCILEIEVELQNMPQSIILEMYNSEFAT